MTDSAAASGAEAPGRRLLRQRVEQVSVVLMRNSVPTLAADALLVYAVSRDGALWAALAWFVVIEATMLLRRRLVSRWLAGEAGDPAAIMQQLVRWSALQGGLRAAIVMLAFIVGSEETKVLVTMVVIGLGAGAVAICGGEPTVMRVWSYPALGSLSLAWLTRLTWESATVGLLIAYLHHVLVGYVEFLGKQGRQLMDYAAELETERDRVRQVNAALERSGEELRAERDRAAEANAAKTRVLASVSHDLRQPLFALSLNTSALGDRLEGLDDPHLARIDAGLRRGLTQCRGLLDQLVDFSRLEAGTVDIRWRSVELGPFLQALVAPYEAAARAAGLRWELDPGGEPAHAWTDALLLERLLGNLLQNAVKFTIEGRVGLRVLRGSVEGRVRVEVFDSGPGIAAAQQQRVFEAFYQLDNPSRDRTRGLGLGLSIVQRLGQLLDVRVTLHSAAGQGCRFVVDLPRSSGAALPEPSARTAAALPPPAASGRPRVVLAIDDEPDLLADLSTMLGGRGYTVLTATDADEACAQARQQTPDIVLADFRLRNDRTGLQAVQAVRHQVGHAMPALIITGDTAPQRIAEATASGLRVLHKPLDGHALAQAVAEALQTQPVQT